ncbi:hypothetical protein J3R83DRAFT_11311 [Lanmaoa asiatica]|nr:hypothetical protein J3R83DRAFT_11311 [Lanmaoa asiatica]
MALEQYYEDHKTALPGVQKKVKDLQAAVLKDPQNGDYSKNLHKEKKWQEIIEEQVHLKGQWLAAIYNEDLALLNNAIITIHLATNKRKHVYMENVKECIIQLWMMHNAKQQDWKSIDMVPGLCATSNSYKQLTLLGLDYFWYLCATIIPQTNHYIHSSIFKIGSLSKDILSPYDVLRNAKTTLIQDPDNSSACTLITQMMTMLQKQKPLFNCVLETLPNKIDEAFRQYLLCDSIIKHMENKSNVVWMTAYSKYRDAIVIAFEQTVSELKRDGVVDSASPDVRTAYNICTEKVLFVLNFQHSPDLPSSLSLMSASVWDTLANHFKHVEHSLIEISLWYSPLVYHQKLFSKQWNIGSATAEMLHALSAHPDLEPTMVKEACRMSVILLLEDFPTLLYMEQQLKQSPPSTCFRITTDLKHFFMFNEALAASKKKAKDADEDEGKGKDIVIEITADEKIRRELHDEVTDVERLIKDFLKPSINKPSMHECH